MKLWTLNSLGRPGFFYVLRHDMLKTLGSSYILLILNHLIHFSQWTLLMILKVCFDGKNFYTYCTSSLHGAYSNPFLRSSSAGKALTSNDGSSFSNSLPLITLITLIFYFSSLHLIYWYAKLCWFMYIGIRSVSQKCKNKELHGIN